MILGAFELNPCWPTQHGELRPAAEALHCMAVRLSDIYPLKKKRKEKKKKYKGKKRFIPAVINKQRKRNRNKGMGGELCAGRRARL